MCAARARRRRRTAASAACVAAFVSIIALSASPSRAASVPGGPGGTRRVVSPAVMASAASVISAIGRRPSRSTHHSSSPTTRGDDQPRPAPSVIVSRLVATSADVERDGEHGLGPPVRQRRGRPPATDGPRRMRWSRPCGVGHLLAGAEPTGSEVRGRSAGVSTGGERAVGRHPADPDVGQARRGRGGAGRLGSGPRPAGWRAGSGPGRPAGRSRLVDEEAPAATSTTAAPATSSTTARALVRDGEPGAAGISRAADPVADAAHGVDEVGLAGVDLRRRSSRRSRRP